MDLGIVCQQASTGGMRYAVMLATAIRGIASDISVTLHHGKKVLGNRELKELQAAGVRLNCLRSVPMARTVRFLRRKRYLHWPPADRVLNDLRLGCREALNRSRHARLVQTLQRHDVVHFAWPYEIDPPQLRVPMTFIPHDFIYSHEFGSLWLDHDFWTSSHTVLDRWLGCATPIVSSDFIAGELARVFPHSARPVEVIYLSSLHVTQPISPPADRAEATCRRLGISGRYILCPNNVMPHKNLSLLIAALWHIREAGEDVRLVAVGSGTAGIRAQVRCPLYGDRVGEGDDWHVLGLGVVDDDDLLDLMRRSLAVVNPSLCEAGTGSGLDAWGCGCAVALSDIPAFRDQVRYLGTRAAFFDPRDPRDAARSLLAIIRDPQARAADGAASRAAMQRYDWSEVARRYLGVFEAVRRSPVQKAAVSVGGPTGDPL